ncbi:MAG: transcription antitermination protein NusB [Bacteroidales bacterium]|nr:transcription antitermination protein NusB [Bacteroidales bacterium]MBP5635709.1 transcription antitermination protein NusB [Bacteroidales bacterium]
MLNRRILRIKAFKVLYSYAENPSMDLKEAQRQLRLSCEATRDLYLFLLALVRPLTEEAAARIEAARTKFNPTEEERNPNLRFVRNRIAPLLSEDPDFSKIVSRKKLSWDQYDAFLRKLYESVRSKDWFKAYLESDDDSLAADAALFTRIFEEELEDNADLEAILEDMSIYWNDDLAYALTWCCHAMDDFARGRRWRLPELVPAGDSFAEDLVAAAFAGFGRYSAMVAESVDKWDKDRLFTTDLALIVTGIAEAERFKDIPARVTINEYVEISKYYGTPKSRSFVNGLLDKLIKQL